MSGRENVYSAEVENARTSPRSRDEHRNRAAPTSSGANTFTPSPPEARGASVTADDLRDHARAFISGYKVPRSVEFVDALPLSGAGKVLKRELRARYERIAIRGSSQFSLTLHAGPARLVSCLPMLPRPGLHFPMSRGSRPSTPCTRTRNCSGSSQPGWPRRNRNSNTPRCD